jgi:integrase
MGAKVKCIKGTWTVVVHHNRRRQMRAVGPLPRDRDRAEALARKVNAAIELGTFHLGDTVPKRALPCDRELDTWLETYRPTLKPTTRKLYEGLIRNHLKPYFGSRDLRELTNADVLTFVAAMQQKEMGPKAIENTLSCLRRVCTLLVEDRRLDRNPISHLASLMRQVRNASATETVEREAWTRSEARVLLELASEHEPKIRPFLVLLFATGLRRGEALGLKWADVDFDRGAFTVRRSVTSVGVSTPKSGRARRVPMTPDLTETLFDLLGERQRERLSNGWPETPGWIFCSETGTGLHPRNLQRTFERLRRRATKQGVRPLSLHSCRHSWATWALQAGKSVKWVADVLGHADPTLTLRVYAHAMPDDETDLSFASLDYDGDRRRYTATDEYGLTEKARNYAEYMVRREGVEPPTLRFEASKKGSKKR